MTNDEIKKYALSLGYEFTDEDCDELRADTYEGETVEDAVNDFLDAYERWLMLKIFLLVLFSSICYASPVMYTKNKGGGLIVLTDEPCYNAKMNKVYSFLESNYKIEGCYALKNGNVDVKWKSGLNVIFSLEIFTMIQKDVKENALFSL